jgi:hypothetical protein
VAPGQAVLLVLPLYSVGFIPSLLLTHCSYQNYKRAKPGNLQRDGSSALSEMEGQWIEKYSHFYGEMMVVCPENHSVNIM